jgi:hypothetical protein
MKIAESVAAIADDCCAIGDEAQPAIIPKAAKQQASNRALTMGRRTGRTDFIAVSDQVLSIRIRPDR